MTVERILRGIAGTVVLLSVALAVFSSRWWLLLTAFAGFNLLQSAFSDACPVKFMLEKLGFAPCVAPGRKAGD